jgi:hypothetical protein
MMEAVRTSETSVYSNKNTWRYNSEGSHLKKILVYSENHTTLIIYEKKISVISYHTIPINKKN